MPCKVMLNKMPLQPKSTVIASTSAGKTNKQNLRFLLVSQGDSYSIKIKYVYKIISNVSKAMILCVKYFNGTVTPF